jgi:succinoglycan biosynthesis protein ExoL
MQNATVTRVVGFGHNRSDAAFKRRIKSLLDADVEVVTFTFRRDGEPEHPGPPWSNFDLGYVEHARLFGRLALYLGAMRVVARNSDLVRKADVILARNLDICVFAMLAVRWAMRLQPAKHRLVYECLDVHETLCGSGSVSRLLRWVERRVLNKASLLLVSSPGFLRHYFQPVQKYEGPHLWVENKLYFGDHPRAGRHQAPHAAATGVPTAESKLTIGWVGIIRCQRTLELLKALATARSGRINIRIAGLVSYFLIEDFDAQIAGYDNITFCGRYDWPSGLAEVYRNVDLVWAQELSWKGGNSDWLIPNRVYEASYFGVPSISVDDTETARFVREKNIGYVLPDDSSETLIAFVDGLDVSAVAGLKRSLLAMPASNFVAGPEDTAALLAAIRKPRTKGGGL